MSSAARALLLAAFVLAGLLVGLLASPPASAQPSDEAAPASTPRERAPLVTLVQPLWSELTAEQRAVLAPFAEQWNIVPATEKRAWLALVEHLPKMSPAERRRAERRIREWAALTPEQRAIARNNFRIAREMPVKDRLSTWRRYETLTPEQRAVLREAGRTSNTAAGHAGAPTGLAKEAAQPMPRATPTDEAGDVGR